jgi:hypothetical protein
MTDTFYDGVVSMLLQMQSVPKSNVHLYAIQQYGDRSWTCKFELDTRELKIAISRDADRPDLAVLACFHAWKSMQESGTEAIKPALLGFAHPAASEKELDDSTLF